MKNIENNNLIEDKLPELATFKQLSDMLMLNKKVLAYMVTFSEKNYRMFNIPKRTGGVRVMV